MSFQSPFLQEFEARGFYAQATHAHELDELMSEEKITAYIGFDCTAKSLHAGSLIQIMILRLLQKHGHKPLVLLGGGTTKIGDPSGKDESRKILSDEEIKANLSGIRQTLEKFVEFEAPSPSPLVGEGARRADEGSSKAITVNNNDWLKNLNYIDFLRNIGRHFSMNRMLTFDSVKTRLEREQPLSFIEFNYMVLQAYDFYFLNREMGCRLQIGGSDQWGNIVNGVELTRRIDSTNPSPQPSPTRGEGVNRVFGLISPLLTTADGKKMGKTAEGAVWLDAEMLSPFDYFQYFRNVDDKDVGKFLKLFVDCPDKKNPEEWQKFYADLEELEKSNINQAKERLAFEATKICHGEKIAREVLAKAREIFISKNAAAFEEKEIFLAENGEKKLTEIIREIGATSSNGEAKKLIEGKAVKINRDAVSDTNHLITKTGNFELSIGKKKFFKILVKNS